MPEAAVAIEFFSDPRAFRQQAGEHLAADPLINTVVTTVTELLADRLDRDGTLPDLPYPQWWALVRDGTGVVVGAAMRTAPFPPYPLFVLPMPELGARELARALHERSESIAGANGALPATGVFADETARLSGRITAIHRHSRLFELGDLIEPPMPVGRPRPARADEAELVLAWFRAFHVEADEQAGRQPDATQGEHFDLDEIAARIDAGRVLLWVDQQDRPVHLTGISDPSYGVSRIGPVYTPREHRGRGYAGAAVAEASRRILGAGVRACLFTDRANPVSNAIYQRLGYRAVVDMIELRLTADAPS